MSASTRAVDPAGRVTVSPLPLPQPLQRFGVAERDGRLQSRAVLHLGQVHHRAAQAGPAARGRVPGCGSSEVRTVPRHAPPSSPRPRRPPDHVLDVHATRLIRTGHGTLLGSSSDPVRTGPCPGAAGRNSYLAGLTAAGPATSPASGKTGLSRRPRTPLAPCASSARTFTGPGGRAGVRTRRSGLLIPRTCSPCCKTLPRHRRPARRQAPDPFIIGQAAFGLAHRVAEPASQSVDMGEVVPGIEGMRMVWAKGPLAISHRGL